MRSPDLVVQYLSGPAKQHPSVGYAGVFKAVDELDEVFAASEPPTHDSWNPGQLQGRNASYVRTAHRRLSEHTRRLAGVAGGAVPVSSVSAGSLSRRLGHLLAGALEPAAASGGGSGGGGGGGAGGGGRRRRPRLEGVPRFVELDGRLVLSQQVSLPEDGTYTASCRVLTGDGSPEREAPVGAAMPTVIGWRFAGGFAPGATLEVVDIDDAELLVEPVGDAVVDITVRSSE
jgi:hypothetical protein